MNLVLAGQVKSLKNVVAQAQSYIKCGIVDKKLIIISNFTHPEIK